MELTEQQGAAAKAVEHWLKHDSKKKQIFYLAGYAGTGKTTIAKLLGNTVKKIVYAAFTGKAALMMSTKGCHGASTIHSLIYKVVENTDGTVDFVLDSGSTANLADLIVIDECSMVDQYLGKDLMSFGKPILVIGDPAQLPPVGNAGFFTNREPDFMLTEIHRQAKDNPIIAMATKVRKGETLDMGNYGSSRVVTLKDLNADDLMNSDQILAGKNITRENLNKFVRDHKGYKGPLPLRNEKLVCLRNDKKLAIFNGGIFTVLQDSFMSKARRDCVNLRLKSEDFSNRAAIRAYTRKEFFTGGYEDIDWRVLKNTHQFTWGYTLTTHKSQGSQWEDVVVFDESDVFREHSQNWLYTAITRASERVTIIR